VFWSKYLNEKNYTRFTLGAMDERLLRAFIERNISGLIVLFVSMASFSLLIRGLV